MMIRNFMVNAALLLVCLPACAAQAAKASVLIDFDPTAPRKP